MGGLTKQEKSALSRNLIRFLAAVLTGYGSWIALAYVTVFWIKPQDHLPDVANYIIGTLYMIALVVFPRITMRIFGITKRVRHNPFVTDDSTTKNRAND